MNEWDSNVSLTDLFQQNTLEEIKDRLAREYREGQAESAQVSRDFESADGEGWPSW